MFNNKTAPITISPIFFTLIILFEMPAVSTNLSHSNETAQSAAVPVIAIPACLLSRKPMAARMTQVMLPMVIRMVMIF